MLRLEHHHACKLLSFQEEQAVRWLLKCGGRSSNVNAAISFAGEIVPRLLRQAVEAACRTYDGLRTRFTPNGGDGFIREVLPADACPVEFIVRSLGNAVEDPAVSREVADFCDRPFAFDQEAWLRVLLIHTRSGSSIIAISAPHVIADASSIRLIISNAWHDYALLVRGARLTLRQPRYSLQDFVGSQRAWAATPDFSARLGQLLDYTTEGIVLARRELPFSYASSSLGVRPSVAVTRKLPEVLSEGLIALSARAQTSLQVTLVAAASLTLATLFQRRHLCLRLPFSNRAYQGADEIVGFLANDVPLLLTIDEDLDCASFIKLVQRHLFSTMRLGALPWAVLKARMEESGTLAERSPFEDYLINVFPALDDIGTTEARAKPFPMRFSGFTSNALKVWMQTINGRVALSLRVGLEDKEMAEQRYMPEFIRVFTAIVDQPACRVGTLIENAPVDAYT